MIYKVRKRITTFKKQAGGTNILNQDQSVSISPNSIRQTELRERERGEGGKEGERERGGEGERDLKRSLYLIFYLVSVMK